MQHDWFEQLADTEVPPVPVHFEQEVRRRVNNALLIAHAVELGTKALVYACGEFARALAGLIVFSVSGKYGGNRRQR